MVVGKDGMTNVTVLTCAPHRTIGKSVNLIAFGPRRFNMLATVLLFRVGQRQARWIAANPTMADVTNAVS